MSTHEPTAEQTPKLTLEQVQQASRILDMPSMILVTKAVAELIARAERAERLIKEGWVRANVITGKGERTPEAAVSDLVHLYQRESERAKRAEAKLLKPSPISYDDLIQCPEKCAEYLKLHDAIIEDDDGIRTCADGTKRQTDRRLGYSLCWPHGVMLIGHKGCYPRAEKWAALFIYFWKYHKVPCDVLDEMLGELTGIHYVMEQRDEAIATAKEAHARIGAAIARAERAEREAKEAKATLFPRWRPASEHGPDFEDGEAMLVAVRAGALGRPSWWDVAFVTIRCDEGQFQVRCEGEPWGWEWCDVVYYIPARELTASIPALTRNSAGGGLEHERGAGRKQP